MRACVVAIWEWTDAGKCLEWLLQGVCTEVGLLVGSGHRGGREIVMQLQHTVIQRGSVRGDLGVAGWCGWCGWPG